MTIDEFDALAPGARVCWAGRGNERLPGTVVGVATNTTNTDPWRTIRVRWDDDKPGLEPAVYVREDAKRLRLWPVLEVVTPEPTPIPTPTKRSTRVQTRPRSTKTKAR